MVKAVAVIVGAQVDDDQLRLTGAEIPADVLGHIALIHAVGEAQLLIISGDQLSRYALLRRGGVAADDAVAADGHQAVISVQRLCGAVGIGAGRVLGAGDEVMFGHLVIHAVATGDGIANELHKAGFLLRRADVFRFNGLDAAGGHGGLTQLHDADDMLAFLRRQGEGLFRRVDHRVHHAHTIQLDGDASLIVRLSRVGSAVIPRDHHRTGRAVESKLRAGCGESQPKGILAGPGAAQRLDIVPVRNDYRHHSFAPFIFKDYIHITTFHPHWQPSCTF